MVWRLPPPRMRPKPVGTASRSTSDAAEASVDGIRFMVRPRDGVIWRDLRCQTLVTPSDSARVAIPGAVYDDGPRLERRRGAERGDKAADSRIARAEAVVVDGTLSDRHRIAPRQI